MRSYRGRITRSLSIALISSAPVLLPSCAPESPPYYGLANDEVTTPESVGAEPTIAHDGRVVIVTLDGALWQDVIGDGMQGNMPRLERLVRTQGLAFGAGEEGCGVVQTASGANISLPGYLEIFSGHAQTCTSNECERTTEATVFDEAALAGRGPVASISSWPQIDRAVSRGQPGVLVAAGRNEWPEPRPAASGRLEALLAEGDAAAPHPSTGNYRPDLHTARLALEYYVERAPALFHVGLVDMDEWAHRADRDAYLQALGHADEFIGDLSDAVANSEAGDRTTFIVTADHGRNGNFSDHTSWRYDSSRTFVIAFGPRVPHRGVLCAPRNLTLADIAPTVRVILGLPPMYGHRVGRPIAEIFE